MHVFTQLRDTTLANAVESFAELEDVGRFRICLA